MRGGKIILPLLALLAFLAPVAVWAAWRLTGDSELSAAVGIGLVLAFTMLVVIAIWEAA